MIVNQLKAGAFLSYVSIALNNIIGLLYIPFMLRMMGQSEYGLYSLVASVVAYLTILDLGFGNAIVRYTAKFRAEGKIREQYEMFGMFFLLYIGIGILSLLVGLVLYFNIDYLFDATMNEGELYKIRIMMLLMIFNLAFTFPMSIWGAIITAYENFVFQQLVGIVRVILNPLVMIMMLLMGYRAIGMVVVTTIFNVVTLLINYWYCKRELKIQVRFGHFRWGFFKEVSVYSFWIFLNAIMDRIYWSTGQFVLGVFKGAATVAVYAVAIQLYTLYMSFSTSISGVFLPKITSMITQKSSDKEISDIFIKMGRIQFVIMSFVLSGFILFGRQFINLWAGTDYDEAYMIALLLFIPGTVPLIQNLGIVILQAKNQMKFRSLCYVFVSIIGLLVSIPLAKLYGGIGCVIGTSLSVVLGQVFIINIYYYKVIHIDVIRFWKEIAKMMISPLIFIIFCLLFINDKDINSFSILILYVIAFSVIYVFGFYKFSMNKYERELFVLPLFRLLGKSDKNECN